VLISAIVFMLGCLLIGFMFSAGSLSKYRQDEPVKPSLASTPQLLKSADGEVTARFGRPRTDGQSGSETWVHHSPQELFGQASAAPSEE